MFCYVMYDVCMYGQNDDGGLVNVNQCQFVMIVIVMLFC